MSYQAKKEIILGFPATEAHLVHGFYTDVGFREWCGGEQPTLEQETEQKADKAGTVRLAPGQILEATGFETKCVKSLPGGNYAAMEEQRLGTSNLPWLSDLYGDNGPRSPLSVGLTARDVARWKRAWSAVHQLGQSHDSFHRDPWQMPILRRCQDWPDIEKISELPTALGFSAAALIYGGLHALAWFAHFDSSAEQLMWRIAACVVMGGLPLVYVLSQIMDYRY